MNGTDSKQSAGYFREKAIIGLSILTGDDIDKAIMKVSSHMLKAPKEKYMQTLLAASYGHSKQLQKNGYPINEYIVRELEKRTHTHNWVVVLKSLVSLHRLFTDASDDMVRTICFHRNIFETYSIKELGDTAAGAFQKNMIMDYMSYLEGRCICQQDLGFNRRIETTEFESYLSSTNADNLLTVMDPLMTTLETLCCIKYNEAGVDNFCTLEVFHQIIRDGKNLYKLLSERIVFALNGFEDFSLNNKKLWLELYKRYSAVVAVLKSLFDSMRRSTRAFMVPIPQLKTLPSSLLRELETVVRVSEETMEVCSLKSLGISTEGPRIIPEEELPVPMEDAAKDEPASARPYSAPPQIATPKRSIISIDDLFGPSEPLTEQTPQSVSPATVANTATWSNGVPGNWSTGVPTDASPEHAAEENLPLEYFSSTPSYATTFSNTQPSPVRTQDPFKELYTQSR